MTLSADMFDPSPEARKEALARARDIARREALEEAARVAESYEPRCDVCPRGVANAIRALEEGE